MRKGIIILEGDGLFPEVDQHGIVIFPGKHDDMPVCFDRQFVILISFFLIDRCHHVCPVIQIHERKVCHTVYKIHGKIKGNVHIVIIAGERFFTDGRQFTFFGPVFCSFYTGQELCFF